jgi:hypothetical protein
MTDGLALRIAKAASPYVDPSDVASIVEAIQALGYTFVPPGTPGRLLENDEAHRGLAEYLRREIDGIDFRIASKTIAAIHQLGFALREPDQHPSGLRTTEHAFTTVRPFGAKYTAAMKTIDKSQFDTNGVEIDKR